MKKLMIVMALLVVMPSFAHAASRHHHENQFQYGEHRNAYFLGGLGIGRSFSTDRESFVMVLGN
jgi:hypothetical protein